MPLRMPSFERHGHCGHRVRLVHHGDVVEDAFAVFVHAANAVLNDDGKFVGERRIVGAQVGNREREDVAVAVLVLQAFAGKRGAPGSAAEQESAARMSAAAQMKSPMRWNPNME